MAEQLTLETLIAVLERAERWVIPEVDGPDEIGVRKILTALKSGAYVLAPAEPTEAMTRVGWGEVRDGIAINDDADRTMGHAYRAMIAAASEKKDG